MLHFTQYLNSAKTNDILQYTQNIYAENEHNKNAFQLEPDQIVRSQSKDYQALEESIIRFKDKMNNFKQEFIDKQDEPQEQQIKQNDYYQQLIQTQDRTITNLKEQLLKYKDQQSLIEKLEKQIVELQEENEQKDLIIQKLQQNKSNMNQINSQLINKDFSITQVRVNGIHEQTNQYNQLQQQMNAQQHSNNFDALIKSNTINQQIDAAINDNNLINQQLLLQTQQYQKQVAELTSKLQQEKKKNKEYKQMYNAQSFIEQKEFKLKKDLNQFTDLYYNGYYALKGLQKDDNFQNQLCSQLEECKQKIEILESNLYKSQYELEKSKDEQQKLATKNELLSNQVEKLKQTNDELKISQLNTSAQIQNIYNK